MLQMLWNTINDETIMQQNGIVSTTIELVLNEKQVYLKKQGARAETMVRCCQQLQTKSKYYDPTELDH